MTRRETVLALALAVVVAGGGGYALAANTTAPAAAPAAATTAPATTSTTTAPDKTAPATATTAPATGTPGAGATGMPAEAATGYSNNQLATSIAQQTGTQLAADSPVYVPPSRAQAMAGAVPPGAREDGSTITFTSSRVSFTVAAVPPGGPDMTFRIGGLVNPSLVIPAHATVTVEFINADTDQAHGWEVTSLGPLFPFQIGQPALTGAFARGLGDPTSAGDGAETITFNAGNGGQYHYVCPMPGHAQMGMHGSLTVR
jgi:rusticyanin